MSSFEHEMKMYYLDMIQDIYDEHKPEGEYVIDLEFAQRIYDALDDLYWDAAYKGLSLYTDSVKKHMDIWKRIINNINNKLGGNYYE